MLAAAGRIVQTRGRDRPYKVVLDYDEEWSEEVLVGSIREGEELIRRRLASAPETFRHMKRCRNSADER
ncbi:MAG: hypothetical protein AVDCRST_MAG93-7317 [uncultured Chloroflexia bacterium]|uniref:Uncharacterized protein n=1 Tax=uncultured Chloroflexia bacterium TaxID=1672391 RepID=A0A6J4MDY6_9CHLR|nr:MAG: hypothetical protein AVDCRST_MAG93-7317 [uncultured Chloroflexia bacterium]